MAVRSEGQICRSWSLSQRRTRVRIMSVLGILIRLFLRVVEGVGRED